MNLLAHIAAKDAFRDLHWCPCCRDRLHADDMDLSRSYTHSQQMRDRYGAACCNACTDRHILTSDGVVMPMENAVYNADLDAWFSDVDAECAALDDADADRRDRSMMRGWL